MKQILFLVLVAIVGYKGWQYFQMQSLQPLYDQPYLIVYGRDSCGYTRNTIKELSNAGIKFEYLNVDSKQVADSLHSRMEAAGIDTKRYLLPVVDLNGSISVRPDNGQVIDGANALSL